MADIYAVFGTLLALGIAFPGMLLALRLLFPGFVGRAQERILSGPGSAFGIGLLAAGIATLPVGVLLALPFGPAKFLGVLMLTATLTFASLGAAGIAGAMASNYARADGEGISQVGAFVRAAVALELAAAFPGLGWFLVIPTATLTSLGAAVGALLFSGARSARNAGDPVTAEDSGLLHEPQSA